MSKQAILEAVHGWSDDDWEEVLLNAPSLAGRLRNVLGCRIVSNGDTPSGQLWKALTADDRHIIGDDYPELAEALNKAAGLRE